MRGGSTFWIKVHDGQPSHGALLFSTAHPKEKGLRRQYPGGSKLTGTAAWGKANPNYPAISCFSFLWSFIQRHKSALHGLNHLKTSGEGNRQVAGQRSKLISAWEKRKQTQHAQDWHWVPWPGRSLRPSSSGLDPASLQVSCNTLVKCRSCSAPFPGFSDTAGLVFAYKGLLYSEMMQDLQTDYCPEILPTYKRTKFSFDGNTLWSPKPLRDQMP